MATITKQDLKDLIREILVSELNALSVSKETPKKATKVASVKKQVSKKVNNNVVKAPSKTTKVAPQSPKKGWVKFNHSNLPKEYTFMKATFKDGSKAFFGRFKYVSTLKGQQFITLVDNKKQEATILFDTIQQVYEYHR
jgi:hypothetical protein